MGADRGFRSVDVLTTQQLITPGVKVQMLVRLRSRILGVPNVVNSKASSLVVVTAVRGKESADVITTQNSSTRGGKVLKLAQLRTWSTLRRLPPANAPSVFPVKQDALVVPRAVLGTASAGVITTAALSIHGPTGL